jgi:hypothetical protein
MSHTFSENDISQLERNETRIKDAIVRSLQSVKLHSYHSYVVMFFNKVSDFKSFNDNIDKGSIEAINAICSRNYDKDDSSIFTILDKDISVFQDVLCFLKKCDTGSPSTISFLLTNLIHDINETKNKFLSRGIETVSSIE